MRVLDEVSVKGTKEWLCIALVNTVENRNEELWQDYLTDVGMLAEGLYDRGILTRDQYAAVKAQLETSPDAATALLADTKELREVLFHVFSSIADRRVPAPAQLEALNGRIAKVYSHLELNLDGLSVHWRWRGSDGRLDAILWPVVHSASQLLTSPELDRVRNCDGHKCTFLFLDRSKNHSRRWCTMDICGNRAKSRRHYARTKSQ